MDYAVVPMNEAQAREYLAWTYPAPYDFYTVRPQDRKAELAGILARAGDDYYAVLDGGGALVGMYEYTFIEDMMEIGLGLAPDRTGQGLGLDFVRRCVTFGREAYGHRGPVVLLVADFNLRAIRVYEKLGFRTAATVTRPAHDREVTFLFMSLDPRQPA